MVDLIPEVAERGLAEFCDVYCDEGYFDLDQTRRILVAGLAAGLRPKLHLDAYSHTEAAALAVELGAASVDHLNFTTAGELEALAARGVVGVYMPCLDLAVAHPAPLDPRTVVDAGMELALATDICPGCWTTSMQLAVALACRLGGLSVARAIRAANTACPLARARGPDRIARARRSGRPARARRPPVRGHRLPPRPQLGDDRDQGRDPHQGAHDMIASQHFHAELAWLGGPSATTDVLIETQDGTITAVTPGVPAPTDANRLAGLTLPGLVNTHSHVFHRAIRGHRQSGIADFWAWRDLMYRVAGRLDPESMYALARATYAEMALSGITSVGEFHYLHHGRDGSVYDDPNAMGDAVISAAGDAGIRITLLDTCYLQADVAGAPITGVQRRFDDGSWQAWAQRLERRSETPRSRVGAAIHSVRAVPRSAMAPIAELSHRRGLPLHVHLSEQPAENLTCQHAYGLTPTALLDAGACRLAERGPFSLLTSQPKTSSCSGGLSTSISMCLHHRARPRRRRRPGGSPRLRRCASGSDSPHGGSTCGKRRATIELDERLVSRHTGPSAGRGLLTAMTASGAALSRAGGRRPDRTGRLSPTWSPYGSTRPARRGARAGDPLAHAVFAATGADVGTVVVGGYKVGRRRSARPLPRPVLLST